MRVFPEVSLDVICSTLQPLVPNKNTDRHKQQFCSKGRIRKKVVLTTKLLLTFSKMRFSFSAIASPFLFFTRFFSSFLQAYILPVARTWQAQTWKTSGNPPWSHTLYIKLIYIGEKHWDLPRQNHLFLVLYNVWRYFWLLVAWRDEEDRKNPQIKMLEWNRVHDFLSFRPCDFANRVMVLSNINLQRWLPFPPDSGYAKHHQLSNTSTRTGSSTFDKQHGLRSAVSISLFVSPLR